MSKIKFSDIVWPLGMNLDILFSVLPEEKLIEIIKRYQGKTRKERRIILPSRRCIDKCLIFYLVEKHEGNFDIVMEALKGHTKFLKESGLRRDKVKQLYEQRKKEIEKEKRER